MTATLSTVPPAPTASRAARPRTRRVVAPYLMLAPGVLILVLLLGWPAVQVIGISFRRLDLGELVGGQVVWVGLDNYRATLADPRFWAVTLRTVVFTAACVVGTVLIGLGIAVLLRHLGRVTRTAVQIALVLAWATPIIATTTVFQWMFDQEYGILNKTLVLLGFDSFRGHSWFTSGPAVLTVVGLLVLWQAVPFVAFTLYAGLLGVPRDLYEAAGIDGASPWQAFTAVSWPAVRPMLTMVTFLSVLWDFKVFTQVWAIRQGGPDGGSTTLPVLLYLNGIAGSRFGVAAAVAVLMLLVLVLVTWRYLRLLVRAQETEL